jgi:hypothetical protein
MYRSLEAKDNLVGALRHLEESADLIGIRAQVGRLTFSSGERLVAVWERPPSEYDRQRIEAAWRAHWPGAGTGFTTVVLGCRT